MTEQTPTSLPPILQEREHEYDEWIMLDRSGAAHISHDRDHAMNTSRIFGHRVYKRTVSVSDWSEIVPVFRKGSSDDA